MIFNVSILEPMYIHFAYDACHALFYGIYNVYDVMSCTY